MNVALTFPGCHRRGGVERVVFECARYLSNRGHGVTVFANEWEDVGGSTRYRHVASPQRPWFYRGYAYFRNCSTALAGGGFDVVSTHGCICPLGGVEWVHSVHAAWIERSRQLRRRLSPAWVRQRLNPAHAVLLDLEARHFRERNYRKLIALTPQVRLDLQRLYGVPEEDVVVIPNGFSPEEFNTVRRAEARERMRAKLGLTPEQTTLLFVANELERKGYPALLAALRMLRRPELRLVVVGRADRQEVMRLAALHGLQDQVLAFGPSAEIASYYAAADLFALPTQYEAWGLVIVEALGCGVPVLTSRAAGAAVTVREGVTGELLADPSDPEETADALARMLSRKYLPADEISRTVQAYAWPEVLTRYEQVLAESRNS